MVELPEWDLVGRPCPRHFRFGKLETNSNVLERISFLLWGSQSSNGSKPVAFSLDDCPTNWTAVCVCARMNATKFLKSVLHFQNELPPVNNDAAVAFLLVFCLI